MGACLTKKFSKPLCNSMNAFRRFLTFIVFGFWMGGFTFYALVVIPTAHGVLGGHREVGFITRQVTYWLNLSSLLALALLTWNFFVEQFRHPTLSWRLPGITLGIMFTAQIALFAEHPILDRMLDGETQSISSHGQFYSWHRVYLLTAAVQWLAAILHAWTLTGTTRSGAAPTRHRLR